MDHAHEHQSAPPTGLLAPWFRIPLFLRIAMGLVCGLVLGLALRPMWHDGDTAHRLIHLTDGLAKVSFPIMRALGAIAPPLILLAVIRSLMGTHIKGAAAGKLCIF